MTLILGLGNKARHGKDTVAQTIDSYFAKQAAAAGRHGLLGYKPLVIQSLAFADALYKEVNAFLSSPYGKVWLDGTVDLQIDNGVVLPSWVVPDPKAEKSERAPLGKHAKLLQWWGTEYHRAQDTDYWVKKGIASVNPKAHIVMFTDMRFLNEAAAVKSIGGSTIRVSRKNVDGTPFIDPSRDPLHVSETQLDGYNFDYEITVKTGEQALLEEYAITLVHFLRTLKGH
jgi:hypothetical protein